MHISDIFKQSYFQGFHDIYNYKTNVNKTNALAILKILSYFTVVIPLGFAAVYGATSLCGRVSSEKSLDATTTKTQEEFLTTFEKEQISSLPEVTDRVKGDFFVGVLNKHGYTINRKQVQIPLASKPEAYKRQEQSFKESLESLKLNHKINDQAKLELKVKDKSTEEAISESAVYTIALNFANENHAGGFPGFHKDEKTKLFVYDSPSARAQEESICQRSDLMASLTQLPHQLSSNYCSNYIEAFDSTKMAYVSHNHLFAVQGERDFYHSRYLETPKTVDFVTSAAKYYGGSDESDFSIGSSAYKDAKQRIETHLLAASLSAGAFKTQNPDQAVEVVLGAFGCGAFVPPKNPNEYRKMIANIYKELLPEFKGFFDIVTFAVPTFGGKNTFNHEIFKQIFGDSEKPAGSISKD